MLKEGVLPWEVAYWDVVLVVYWSLIHNSIGGPGHGQWIQLVIPTLTCGVNLGPSRNGKTIRLSYGINNGASQPPPSFNRQDPPPINTPM